MRENLTAVLVDRLVADIVSTVSMLYSVQEVAHGIIRQLEIAENLKDQDSAVHALSSLGNRNTNESTHGKLDEGSGSKATGWAKQC